MDTPVYGEITFSKTGDILTDYDKDSQSFIYDNDQIAGAVYGLYADDFLALTEDHSYIADMLKRGELSEEEAAVHPNRNMLTNALGIWDTVRIDINKIKNDSFTILA